MLGQGTLDNDGLQANNGVASDPPHLVQPWVGYEQGHRGRHRGWSFGGGIYIGYTGNVNHITLDRNFHWAVGISFEETGINNFTITRCYFENAGIGSAFGNQAVSNVMIANNYFSGGIIVDVTFSYVTVANNLFNWNNTHVLHGAEIKNNIFFLGGVQTNNNNIHHNGATGTTNLPAGSNNVPNVVSTNVFDGTYTSDDQKWRLASNYQTYMNLIGDDGTVPGMYGGAWPYRPSVCRRIPAVYQLTAPATAIQGDPLNVTIGTRSND
ncbi:MAG: hypothetical protein IPG10_17800 [Flavobacteriales bacterium]|nr:hypothetical protein [Flavobacteriales bacterium]